MFVPAILDRFQALQLWDHLPSATTNLFSSAWILTTTRTTSLGDSIFVDASPKTSTSGMAVLLAAVVTVYLLARWIWSRTASIMDRICSRTYIYNCCWEDPAVDHEILRIQPDDVIFRICSAGDIVLDYAIEGPSKIVVCDMNQHQ
jgi:hypothetical protein